MIENHGFPVSLAGESPCLLHRFISPFPACELGPTRERDPLLPIVPRSEGTIVISKHCSRWGMNHPLSRKGRSLHRPGPSLLDPLLFDKLFSVLQPVSGNAQPTLHRLSHLWHRKAPAHRTALVQLGRRRGENAGGTESARNGVTSSF